ncbi:MAG: hypothetical protein ACLGHS_13280, partial [Actinomycetes bacterium]
VVRTQGLRVQPGQLGGHADDVDRDVGAGTTEVHAAADATLSIAQFGSTRSINASAAAAIAMHGWVRRHVYNQQVGSQLL